MAKAASEGRKSGSLRRPQALVADDDADLRSLLALVLRREGFDVSEVENGRELVAAVEDAETPPDVVLADVMMPSLGGLGALERLKKLAFRAPIVLLTASGDVATRAAAAALGATALLSKPFDADELRRLLRTLFPRTSTA